MVLATWIGNDTFGGMGAPKEEFVVSARKYRPGIWDEVVGQKAITDTLHNAIEDGHLAHAYLFCGPRGVGKTTCARIFAREINKDAAGEDEDFTFNIFELDAASNNKVEDIRSLTDQVRIPPQIGKYKVYIIDEVHMLSNTAFNAFLKTLEEPPSHAIFILATTEKHKIIPTILSRCQIYDFSRIAIPEIVAHLRNIAENEKIVADEESLHLIAQKADGALRDALSIFDQLASFTRGKLHYDTILKNLHVLDYDFYFKITQHLHSGAYQDALLTFDEILSRGFDGGHFINGLANHFRDLLVCMDIRTAALLDVPERAQKQYIEQSKQIGADWIFESLRIISQSELKIKTAINIRLAIEIALLQLSSITIAEKKNNHPEPVISPISPPGHTNKSVTTLTQTISNPAPEPEPQATQIPSRKQRPKTISLNSIVEPIANQEQAIKSKEEINSVPENQLVPWAVAWRNTIAKVEASGAMTFMQILSRHEPDNVLHEHEIRLKLYNNIEEQELALHRNDFLENLRNESGDRCLTLKVEISEQRSETKLFGAREKFEHLANKNPEINALKSELDLDISY